MARRPDGLLNHNLFDADRGPQDACGVFGVWAPGEEVAKLSFYGLYALQHRGQESAGIATSDGERITVYKDMGLVSQVFTETSVNAAPAAGIFHRNEVRIQSVKTHLQDSKIPCRN